MRLRPRPHKENRTAAVRLAGDRCKAARYFHASAASIGSPAASVFPGKASAEPSSQTASETAPLFREVAQTALRSGFARSRAPQRVIASTAAHSAPDPPTILPTPLAMD